MSVCTFMYVNFNGSSAVYINRTLCFSPNQITVYRLLCTHTHAPTQGSVTASSAFYLSGSERIIVAYLRTCGRLGKWLKGTENIYTKR